MVDVSILPSADAICNHVYLSAKATVVLHIDSFVSREDSLGLPRSFLNLRFDQSSYLLLSHDIRPRPGKGYATSPDRTTIVYCFKY